MMCRVRQPDGAELRVRFPILQADWTAAIRAALTGFDLLLQSEPRDARQTHDKDIDT